jgi:antitoxin CptB
MRELDALLTRWLDLQWQLADHSKRDGFRQLLDCEDDQLWDWLLGRSRPPTEELCRIVDDIRLASQGGS